MPGPPLSRIHPFPLYPHSTFRRLSPRPPCGIIRPNERSVTTHGSLYYRGRHQGPAGALRPDPGPAGRPALRQRQDRLQVGDGPRPARHHPAGAAGRRAARLAAGAALRRGHHQREPFRQPAAQPPVRLPGLRQHPARHRRGGHQLLRRRPAPAGGGSARRCPHRCHHRNRARVVRRNPPRDDQDALHFLHRLRHRGPVRARPPLPRGSRRRPLLPPRPRQTLLVLQ